MAREMDEQQMRIIRLRLGSTTRLINVWSGCSAFELRELIGAAFGVGIEGAGAPVAVISESSGVITPLSVACAHPQSLDSASYAVLRADGVGAEVSADVDEVEDSNPNAPDETMAEDEAKIKKLTELICKFAQLMESHGRLTKLEADTVVALASKRDTVVLAAYAVAASEQNADLLLVLMRKVARDYLRENNEADPKSLDGQAEHAVAQQLLRVIDELFLSKRFQGQIDMAKCRYLQRLVLEKDPVLFAAFNVYEEDSDLDELCDTLLRVSSRANPETSAAPASSQSIDSSTEGKDQQDLVAERRLVEERRLTVFRECMAWLVDKGIIESSSADALLASAATGDERLRKALDAFGSSGDLEKLLETLATVAMALDTAEPRAPASNSTYMDDRHLLVFKECVTWLLQQDILKVDHAEALVRAATNRDPELRAAIDAYTESKDLGQFLETLTDIARVRCETTQGAPAAARPVGTLNQDDGEVTDSRNGAENADDLALKELGELVSCLAEEGKLSKEEHYYLGQLLGKSDARLLAAYDVYVESQDVDDLVDTIMRVGKRRFAEGNGSDWTKSDGDDVDDPEEADDDQSTMIAAPAPLPSNLNDAIAELSQSNLLEIEAAALRLCAARNDPDLAAVLQVYRVEGDRADLEDSLKRIARRTIEETTC